MKLIEKIKNSKLYILIAGFITGIITLCIALGFIFASNKKTSKKEIEIENKKKQSDTNSDIISSSIDKLESDILKGK